MSEWEFAAAAEGWLLAHAPPAEVAAPSPEEHDAMIERAAHLGLLH